LARVQKEHDFVGDGITCLKCGCLPAEHRGSRKEHQFISINGIFCADCGLTEQHHRGSRKRNPEKQSAASKKYRQSHRKKFKFFGIDGEGQGRLDHRYTLLACSDADGEERYFVENPMGLTTTECLDFLWSLPDYVKLFSFSFNYDLTKMLEYLADEKIFSLFRPEGRQRTGKDAVKGPKPVLWPPWRINMQASKFYIRKNEKLRSSRRNVVIWDIFKFFQTKFTNACTDWGVGTEQEIKHMQYMKDHRHEFDKMPRDQVRAYCFKECQFMAQLAEKLTKAHEDAGLQLKSYYGAGSTASAVLKKINIHEYMKQPPKELETILAIAFGGGRFELGYIGQFEGPIFTYDISSAYPYSITFLPCLVHGRWSRTSNRRRIEQAAAAVVNYELVLNTKENHLWAPFPFRTKNGSICYPSACEGWVWKDEFFAGERIWNGVKLKDAWVYETDCTCKPFAQIPELYIYRCLLGKEGAGIATKLGINACAGKIMQSIGNAPYNNWVWAGMITSGCRAQVLNAMGLHKDMRNLLMIATDGIASREKLELPRPKDTGTFNVWECAKHKKTCYECEDRTYKPLGGWEEKILKRGIFLARPGVYFPLNPSSDDIKTVRGRGVGRGTILNHHKNIVSTYNDWNGEGEWPIVNVSNVSRFCGAKTSIHRTERKDGKGYDYHRACGNHLAEKPEGSYGQWLERSVKMSFDPEPKRKGRDKDGSLMLHRYEGELSRPYRKAVVSPEARMLMQSEQINREQPDYDIADYEFEG
jgi:hypothetical protein